jgi:hypothetical protein
MNAQLVPYYITTTTLQSAGTGSRRGQALAGSGEQCRGASFGQSGWNGMSIDTDTPRCSVDHRVVEVCSPLRCC